MKLRGERPSMVLAAIIVWSGCLGCGSAGTSGGGGQGGGTAGRAGSGGSGGAGGAAGSGSTGLGGATSSGGSGGVATQDAGARTDGSSGSCYPGCLESLLDQCPRMGACTEQMPGSGGTIKCWVNGIFDEKNGNLTRRVTSNGDICLTEQVYPGATVSDTYEDFSQGNSTTVVARLQLTTDAQHGTVTCLSDLSAVPVPFDLTSPSCASQLALQQQQCATGTCN